MADRYPLTCGRQDVAIKALIYGHEGIGKSTMAAMLPSPVFIDVENGTAQLPVARMPRPTSWAMLLDEVRSVRDGEVPCSTLVVDTADAAERLCVADVCAEAGVTGIESIPYGKGYVTARERFGRLLDLLSEVVERGTNAVLLSHAILSKFERPDESGSYDRWSLKLIDTKRASVAALCKEWADMVLFLDYDVVVTRTKDGKAKASGGRRVIRTTHSVVWDAKNRFDLPETIDLGATEVSEMIVPLMADRHPSSSPAPEQEPVESPAPSRVTARNPEPSPTPAPAPAPTDDAYEPPTYPARLKPLADLMAAGRVTDAELRHVVGQRGDFTEDCPVENYKQDFVDFLISQWDGVVRKIEINRIPVPFPETEPEDRS